MGWSCNKNAGITMDAISQACIQQTGSQNTYEIKNNKYFWEIGREQHDGAICATIWKFLNNDRCKRAGSLRIEPDGEVSRGPAWMRNLKVYHLVIDNFDYGLFRHGAPTENNLWEAVKQYVENTQKLVDKQLVPVDLPKSAKIVGPNGHIVEWIAPKSQV